MLSNFTTYKIYCDESRQNNKGYKLMGSIWIKEEYGWSFVNDFHSICIKNTGILPGHMKWTKVPNKITEKYFTHYKILIDLFFEYCDEDKMFFKTIIVDSSYNFKHPIYNVGDEETGFYKLYYYLLINSLRYNERYHIRIAERTVSKKKINQNEADRLDKLMFCLNAGFIKKSNYNFDKNIVLSIESRSAKERLLIQLADILMGAVGFQWEELHLKPEAKKTKVYLANYIAQKLGRPNLIFTTAASDRYFNIFHLQPRK